MAWRGSRGSIWPRAPEEGVNGVEQGPLEGTRGALGSHVSAKIRLLQQRVPQEDEHGRRASAPQLRVQPQVSPAPVPEVRSTPPLPAAEVAVDPLTPWRRPRPRPPPPVEAPRAPVTSDQEEPRDSDVIGQEEIPHVDIKGLRETYETLSRNGEKSPQGGRKGEGSHVTAPERRGDPEMSATPRAAPRIGQGLTVETQELEMSANTSSATPWRTKNHVVSNENKLPEKSPVPISVKQSWRRSTNDETAEVQERGAPEAQGTVSEKSPATIPVKQGWLRPKDDSISGEMRDTDSGSSDSTPAARPRSIPLPSGWTSGDLSRDEGVNEMPDFQDGRRGSHTIHLRTISTPEQRLELTLTVSDSSSPTDRRRSSGFALSDLPLPPTTERYITSHQSAAVVNVDRRGSSSGLYFSPRVRHDSEGSERGPRGSLGGPRGSLGGPRDSYSGERRGSLYSPERLEAVALKMDALLINALFLEGQAAGGLDQPEQILQLEADVSRTARALAEISLLQQPELAEAAYRASRALANCRLALEEAAPAIEMQEPGWDERRRASSVTAGEVRSVALRVMALDRQHALLQPGGAGGSRRGSLADI